MNKIQNYAVTHADINLSNLAAILDALNEKQIINLDHVLELILGMKETGVEIAGSAVLNRGKNNEINARFVEYDILTDTVRYEYDDSLRLWFTNEEDAKAFSEGGSYYNRKYAYSEREGFTFPGERKMVSGGLISLEEWEMSL